MVELERGHERWNHTGYTIERRVGGGWCSEVYEARDASGAPCAIKVLREVHGAEAAWRFARELALLSRMKHPNLVRVHHGSVTRDGRPFVVMDLLCGRTLREEIATRGPLEPSRACSIVVGLLDGLERAHRAGVVHRDVKPGNVMLHQDAAGERPVLIDFGAAIDRGLHDEITTGAHVFGTPRYLAPEQILGGAIDPRTDVYAAGLTLFEAIAGRGPFSATGAMELMQAHVSCEPARLSAFVPVGRGLTGVVSRALEKEPACRWPTARAFAAALRRVVVASERRDTLARTVPSRDVARAAWNR